MVRNKKTIRYMAESVVAAAQFAAPFGEWFDENRGVHLGESRFGGGFRFDIDLLMAERVVASPNILIFGSLGQGKSHLLGRLLFQDKNKSALYFDPKGDASKNLSKQGFNFFDRPINPLIPHQGTIAIKDSNFEIVDLACSYLLQRRLTEVEVAAIAECVEAMVFEANIDLLIENLEYLDDRRGPTKWRGYYQIGDLDPLISVCKRLKKGRVMSSAPLTSDDAFEVIAGGGVVDLSYHLTSEHLPLRVALILASLRSAKLAGVSDVRAVGIDELWTLLEDDNIASWIERYFKLARGAGISNFAATHSIDDLGRSSVGRGLLGAVEVFVTFRQSIEDAQQFVKALGLSTSMADLIAELAVGSTLWLVKDRISVIELEFTAGSSKSGAPT